jgi:hypothetical protein
MASTTYTILAEVDGVESVSTAGITKKAKAVELATELRNESKVSVKVQTSSGTVVFELKAPKKIKMSKPYTRVAQLPEGVEVPEGFRVAYFRPRRKVAVLHDIHEGYRLFRTATSELSEEVYETTRDAGKAMLAVS